MPDVIDIGGVLINQKEDIFSYIIVIFFVLAIVIAIYEYKNKLWSYVINRRNKGYFIVLLMTGILIIVLLRKDLITVFWRWTIVGLWILYGIECFLSLPPKKMVSGESKRIYKSRLHRKYLKLMREGWLDEIAGFFVEDEIADNGSRFISEAFRKGNKIYKYRRILNKLRFAADSDRWIEYQMLRSKYFCYCGNYEDAYEALCSIQEQDLYEEEQEEIQQRKAVCLAVMGQTTAALRLLGEPDKKASALTLMIYSYIFELAGDMEQAFQYAKQANADGDIKKSDISKALLQCDYARNVINHGNVQEGLRYLQLAWDGIRGSNDIIAIHEIGNNRLMFMAENGCSREECDKMLEEYLSCKKAETLSNNIRYGNCKVQYYRQIGELDKAYTAIQELYESCKNLLKDEKSYIDAGAQMECIRAKIFRQTMDGEYNPEWLCKEIETSLEYYKKFSVQNRCSVFSDYMQVLSQARYKALRMTVPFDKLYKTIGYYYQNEAIEEIDAERCKVKSYNIHSYTGFLQWRLEIFRFLDKYNYVEKNEAAYMDLYKTLNDGGLRMEAVCILMDFVEECSRAENLEVVTEKGEHYLYSDYLERAPILIPFTSQDGKYKKYEEFIPNTSMVIPRYFDKINQMMDMVVKEVRNWENHSARPYICIRILNRLMCLERYDEAEEFYQFYKKSGISENKLVPWAKEVIRCYLKENKKSVPF